MPPTDKWKPESLYVIDTSVFSRLQFFIVVLKEYPIIPPVAGCHEYSLFAFIKREFFTVIPDSLVPVLSLLIAIPAYFTFSTSIFALSIVIFFIVAFCTTPNKPVRVKSLVATGLVGSVCVKFEIV